MPKRRAPLSPESVYARKALEEWLVNELGVLAAHRQRIWKALQVQQAPASKKPKSKTKQTEQQHASNWSIRAVPDLPQSVYDGFDSKFVVTTTRVVHEQSSEHGAKLVIETADGHFVETVLIHHPDAGQQGRTTVCVSSQIGCRMACTFCATGTLGLSGHLNASEVLEQVWHAVTRHPQTSRVVFMAHGEPLDNYDNVVEAIRCMPDAFGIPLSRVTLSTVGVTHGIKRLARECPEIQLALSLHAPNDEIRRRIVPTTQAFSVSKIMEAVSEYQCQNKRSVMIEYIMIEGVNASPECAHELGRLLQGRNCMVNLIPYNPTDAGDRYGYRSPDAAAISEFQDIVFRYKSHDPQKSIRCTVRWSTTKGQDLDAACGQLVLKNFTKSKSDGCSDGVNQKSNNHQDIEDIIGGDSDNKKRATAKATKARSTKRSLDAKVSVTKGRDRYWYIGCAAGVMALASSALILLRQRKR